MNGREFNLKVKVTARDINERFYAEQPQACEVHEFVYAADLETKLPPPQAEWIVCTETDDDRPSWSSIRDAWLIADQYMCTACLDEMQAHEERP